MTLSDQRKFQLVHLPAYPVGHILPHACIICQFRPCRVHEVIQIVYPIGVQTLKGTLSEPDTDKAGLLSSQNQSLCVQEQYRLP